MPKKAASARKGPGQLIVIGGHEDKEGERKILQAVVETAGNGAIAVMTLASTEGDEMWDTYRKVFGSLGAKKTERLDLDFRADAGKDHREEILRTASLFFFTGGDQLRITS